MEDVRESIKWDNQQLENKIKGGRLGNLLQNEVKGDNDEKCIT